MNNEKQKQIIERFKKSCNELYRRSQVTPNENEKKRYLELYRESYRRYKLQLALNDGVL